MKWQINFLLALLSLPMMAQAQAPTGSLAQSFNFDGALQDSGGNPITSATPVKFQIYNPAKNCRLYEEDQTVSPTTDGSISVQIGSATGNPKRGAGDKGLPWASVFNNSAAVGPGGGDCSMSYTPIPGDVRYLRVIVNGNTLSPDFLLSSAPTATVAETLQGKPAGAFLQTNTSGLTLDQANLETLFTTPNFAKLNDLFAGNYMRTAPTAAVSYNNQRLTDVAAPASAMDAVNKNYADQKVGAKDVDFTGVGPASGNGQTIIWDQVQNKWVTGLPSAIDATKLPLAGGTMAGALDMGSNDFMNTGHITMMPNRTFRLSQLTATQESSLNTGSWTAPYAGTMWYRADSRELRVYDGVATVTVGGAAGAFKADGSVPMTGQIEGIPGSFSNPSWTFDGDEDTGIYNSGPGDLSTTHNGSPGFLINSMGIESWMTGGIAMRSASGMSSWNTYAFKGDLGTGMFSPSAGTLSLSTSGMERVTISSMGNVGIGTTAPSVPLEVKGIMKLQGTTSGGVSLRAPAVGGSAIYQLPGADGTANQVLKTDGAGVLSWTTMPGGTGDFKADGSVSMTGAVRALGGTPAAPAINFGSDPDTGIYSSAADNLAVTTGGQPRLFIDAGGNVGVGTIAPASKFEVQGNQSTVYSPTYSGQHPGSPGSSLFIKNTYGQNGTGAYLVLQPTSTSAASQNAYIGAISTGSSYGSAMVFGHRETASNIKERMRIDENGNIGIGTAAPAFPLHVSSPTHTVATIESGIANGVALSLNATGTNGRAYELISTAFSSPEGAGKFVINDVMNSMARLVIDQNGLVGIGTNNPMTALDVNGTAQVSQLQVGGGTPINKMLMCTFSTTAGFNASSSAGAYQSKSCAGVTIGAMVSCSPDTAPVNTVTWNAFVETANNIKLSIVNTSPTSSGFAAATNWKCLVVN